MSNDDKKKSKRQLEKEQKIKHPLLNRKERDRRAWTARRHREMNEKIAQQNADSGPSGGFSRPVGSPSAAETDMMKPLSSLRERVLKSRARMKGKWRDR